MPEVHKKGPLQLGSLDHNFAKTFIHNFMGYNLKSHRMERAYRKYQNGQV